jgi:hypothetical protein
MGQAEKKEEAQVKTKKRVEDHGEVFTSEREVNAMLDLVKQETQRIDSRFLEPACGNGNFLAEILRRKLEIVKSRYKKSQIEFERYSITALSSIYGIDILEDNVHECRERLFEIFDKEYTRLFKEKCKQACRDSAWFILSRNILWGDALTLKTVCGNEDPIVFSEWSTVNGSRIKRRDYTLANLLAYQPMESGTLFSDLGEEAFIPKPVKDFPVTHFLELKNHV